MQCGWGLITFKLYMFTILNKVVIEIARKNALRSTTNTELITTHLRWFLIRSWRMKHKRWLTRECSNILIGWSWKIKALHLLGGLFSQHSQRSSKIGTTKELITIIKLDHQRSNRRYNRIETPINKAKRSGSMFLLTHKITFLREWCCF